jgi:hypothetical protein
MHAVVRTYSGKGAKELIDLIEKNKPEVEKLIRGVKGFVSYSLVRTADGGLSVSVYQDKAGTDESLKVCGRHRSSATEVSLDGNARSCRNRGAIVACLRSVLEVGVAALGGGEQFKVLLKAAGFPQADQRRTQRGGSPA